MGKGKRSWATMTPDRLMERFTTDLPFVRVRSVEVDRYGLMSIGFTIGDKFKFWSKPVASVREWENSIAFCRMNSGNDERTEVA